MSRNKTTNSYTKYIRRVLMWAAAITSGAVLLFALTTIATTDEMARGSNEMYVTGYDAMFSARTMQAGLLRVRRQVASYLMDPTLEESRTLLTDIHRWQRQNTDAVDSFRSLLTGEEYETLNADLAEIYAAQNEAIATAQSGDVDGGMQIYNSVLKSLYERADTSFETILSDGVDILRDGAERAQRTNEQINLWCIIFGIGIVVLSLVTAWVGSRRIEQRSGDAYRMELLFNFIGRHADDVFEIYGFDEGQMAYASENIQRVFGVSAEEYLKNNTALQEYIHPDDRAELVNRYYDKDGEGVSTVEFRYRNPSTGREQIFQSTFFPVFGADGDVHYHILLTRDVTADRQAQETLQHALAEAEYANKSRREFLSRMSHEIRTPINGIMGMQKVASDALDDSETVKRSLQQINSSSQHLLSLVEDILDMSKIESGRMELSYAPFSLDHLLSNLKAIVSHRIEEKHQRFDIDIGQDVVGHLIGDEVRLRQILLNLLSNASKYTQEGGSIRLIVRQSEPKYGFADTTFSVEDNGRGISANEAARLFVPFERGAGEAERTSGTGLGLPISRHVVNAMGGTIWAESVEGEGSVFSFEVSLGIDEKFILDVSSGEKNEPEKAAVPEAPDEPGVRRHAVARGTDEAEKRTAGTTSGATEPDRESDSIRVLVVDDNIINMEVTSAILRQAGYTVEVAHNGREALDMFEAAPDGWYQAVFMDIRMPVMDGLTATRRIRNSTVKDGTKIPIYAVTAEMFVTEDSDGPVGFTEFFTKPMDSKQILASLEQSLQNLRDTTNT